MGGCFPVKACLDFIFELRPSNAELTSRAILFFAFFRSFQPPHCRVHSRLLASGFRFHDDIAVQWCPSFSETRRVARR